MKLRVHLRSGLIQYDRKIHQRRRGVPKRATAPR